MRGTGISPLVADTLHVVCRKDMADANVLLMRTYAAESMSSALSSKPGSGTDGADEDSSSQQQL